MPTRENGSRLEWILPRVKGQCQVATGFDEHMIYVSDQPDEVIAANPPADLFLTIRPEVFPANEGAIAGGGSLTLLFEGVLTFGLWNRFSVDQTTRDDSYLIDKEHGILARWSNLLKVTPAGLYLYDPVDPDTEEYLLAEPMRPAARGFRFRRRQPTTGWGKLESVWELTWKQDVTT